MADVLWLGMVLGVGQALAVGPIFLAIVQQAATRGVGAGCRVILGATACDVLLLLPALLFAGAIRDIGGVMPWLGALGALCFVYLGQAAGRDAYRLWRGGGPRSVGMLGPFWQGLVGSLANPLAWTLWLAAVAPALLRAERTGGYGGLFLFVVAWFASVTFVELLVALASARAGGLFGGRVQAYACIVAAFVFFSLAGQLAASAFPQLLAS